MQKVEDRASEKNRVPAEGSLELVSTDLVRTSIEEHVMVLVLRLKRQLSVVFEQVEKGVSF